MSYIRKYFFELFILVFSIYNWFCVMMISSDLPIEIGLFDTCYRVIAILFCGYLYLKGIKSNVMSMVSLLPIMLWFIEALYSMMFNYHPYVTLLTIVGAVVSGASFVYVRKVKLNRLHFRLKQIKVSNSR
ncbi:MAG TPA: hypothetical protein DCY20_03135 [Firmicutes bacterium]|nr:hypothetical protein [Bacillota bacterium]